MKGVPSTSTYACLASRLTPALRIVLLSELYCSVKELPLKLLFSVSFKRLNAKDRNYFFLYSIK